MSTLTRRPVLREDIGFDTTGTDEEFNFQRPDGTPVVGHKLNAGSLPLKEDTQTALGESNVDDALLSLDGYMTTALQNATTAQRGRVELATDAETQAGTDAERAITPNGLASLTGTENRRGLIQLATIAEAEEGLNTLKAVTPAGVKAEVEGLAEDNLWGIASSNVGLGIFGFTGSTHITLKKGMILSSDYSELISAVGMSKNINAYWAAGANNGAIAPGVSLTDTYYFLFVIKNTTTGVVDFCIDDNHTGVNITANLGSNYVMRILGIVRIQYSSSDVTTGELFYDDNIIHKREAFHHVGGDLFTIYLTALTAADSPAVITGTPNPGPCIVRGFLTYESMASGSNITISSPCDPVHSKTNAFVTATYEKDGAAAKLPFKGVVLNNKINVTYTNSGTDACEVWVDVTSIELID